MTAYQDSPEYRERLERVAEYIREHPQAHSGEIGRALGIEPSRVGPLRRRIVAGQVAEPGRSGRKGQRHVESTSLDRQARFQTILDDWKRDLERTDGFRKGYDKRGEWQP